jgi:thiol-disulfide isomerase/thioredoxin
VKLRAAPEFRGDRNTGRTRGAQRFTGIAAFSLAFSVLAGILFHSGNARAAQPDDLRTITTPAGPLFKLDDYLSGKPRALTDIRGKIVLLHFFATYCEPCRPEMASLNRFVAANADKPIAVFAVDVGEVDLRVRAFFEKEPVTFPVVLDRDRKIAKSWNVSALPTTIILNEKLEPRLMVEGDLDWSHPEVLKKIETLLPARNIPGPRVGG